MELPGAYDLADLRSSLPNPGRADDRPSDGGKRLPAEVLQQVVANTDGVPLFVEELTKMVLESGLLQEGEEGYDLTGPLPALAIPATLHDSLKALPDTPERAQQELELQITLGPAHAVGDRRPSGMRHIDDHGRPRLRQRAVSYSV
jgi:hypothetical protein